MNKMIKCRFCGQPWDVRKLRESWSDYWDEGVRRAARGTDTSVRAYADVRREWEIQGSPGRFWRAVDRRALYLLTAELFQEFGCRAFGGACR